MGNCFSSNVVVLYAVSMWAAMTSLALGTDYHVYVQDEINKVVSCANATNADYCYIYCDKEESKAYKPGDMTFNCGNSGNCIFSCGKTTCAKSATIIATNVSNTFTSNTSVSGCFTSSDIWLPDEGSASFSMAADKSYSGTVIHSGKNTQNIHIDCTYGSSIDQCSKMIVNATTAQYLEIKAGAGSQFSGKVDKEDTIIWSYVYCPRNSKYNGSEIAPCIFDISDGGLLQYTNIYTQYGIPADLRIKMGITNITQLSKVNILCSAYNRSSMNDNGEDIATEECYITDTPTRYPSVDPTSSPTTPSPTMPGTLTCNSHKNGTFTTDLLFTVRMPYRGQLTFLAITSAALQGIQATYAALPFAGSFVNNNTLILDVSVVGDYKFTIDVGSDVTTDFSVSILCASDAPTSSPTVVPSSSPTMNPTTIRPSAPIVSTQTSVVNSITSSVGLQSTQKDPQESQPQGEQNGHLTNFVTQVIMTHLEYTIIGFVFLCFCCVGVCIFKKQITQKRRLLQQVRDLQGVEPDRKKSSIGMIHGEAPVHDAAQEAVNPLNEGGATNVADTTTTNVNNNGTEQSLDSSSSSSSALINDEDEEKVIRVDPKEQGIKPVVAGNMMHGGNLMHSGNMMQASNMMDPVVMNMNLKMNMNMIADMMGHMVDNMQNQNVVPFQRAGSSSYPHPGEQSGVPSNPLPSSELNVAPNDIFKAPAPAPPAPAIKEHVHFDAQSNESNTSEDDDSMYQNDDQNQATIGGATRGQTQSLAACNDEANDAAMGDVGVNKCAQCNNTAQGKVDAKDGAFYCDKCWNSYH